MSLSQMSKMYGEAPRNYNQTAEISLVQVLTVFAVVFMTLIIPAQLFTYSQGRNSNETAYNLSNVAERSTSSSTTSVTSRGQVAGINTQKESVIQIPGTSSTINLNSQTGIFIIAGIILIALALILVIYLLITG